MQAAASMARSDTSLAIGMELASGALPVVCATNAFGLGDHDRARDQLIQRYLGFVRMKARLSFTFGVI